MPRSYRNLIVLLFVLLTPVPAPAADQAKEKISLEDFIRANVASKKEIDVFLHEMSWAQFDPVVGYTLGSKWACTPDDRSTLSTSTDSDNSPDI